MKLKIFIKNLILFILFQFVLAAEKGQDNKPNAIEVVNFNNVQYISAIDYANHSKMSYVFIENKEKLIIQYISNEIVVSPNSSYIQINDSIYNLSIPTIFDGNDFWMPLNSLSKLINYHSLPSIKLDSLSSKNL